MSSSVFVKYKIYWLSILEVGKYVFIALHGPHDLQTRYPGTTLCHSCLT